MMSNREIFESLIAALSETYGKPITAALAYKHCHNTSSLKGLEKSARQMGIEVIYSKQLNRKVKGILARRDTEKYIFLNPEDHLEQKKFTLAHELGHHVLDHSETEGIDESNQEVQTLVFSSALQLFSKKTYEERQNFLKNNPGLGYVYILPALALLGFGVFAGTRFLVSKISEALSAKKAEVEYE